MKYPPDDLGDIIIKYIAWLMWLAAFGTLSVRLTWTDKRDNIEREYTITGLIL